MPLSYCNTDNVIVGGAVLCLDGTSLGLTSGGVTVRQESEFGEVLADQLNGVAKKFRSLERFFVATSLLEVTLDKLLLAFGYPSANMTSATVLCLGYNSACFLNEKQLVVKGPGPGCGCRTFVFDRVTNVQTTVEYQMFRDQATQLAIEFECLKSCETGFFGCITDGCTFQESLDCDAPA